MIAAAALVFWSGERLSRRVVEERRPADRSRLLDFSMALRGELDGLDQLFSGHAFRIASLAEEASREKVAEACEAIVGIRSCSVFDANGRKRLEVYGKPPPPGAFRLPEVGVEGGAPVLDPDRALLIPGGLSGPSGWLAAPDPAYRGYWCRTGSGLVVLLVDDGELQPRLREHLGDWMKGPSLPLEQAGELYEVSGPGGVRLAAMREDRDAGPAALQIPHRTGLGEWQVYAWDRRTSILRRDAATLWGSGILAAVLVVAGGVLYAERRRGVRLAEERVSFVNRVSHELGTPLTNILLNLDLAAHAVERRPHEAERRLGIAAEEVRRLARLVGNVLTFSRGERKALELRRVSCLPDQVIGGVLEQFQPSLARRGILVEWRAEAVGPVMMDPDALAQIAGNLISNVEKYAAGGGWLGVESRLEDGCLHLRVADRGPGIPRRMEGRVFAPFSRLRSEVSEGASGTGLGLAIARDLARRADGELVFLRAEGGAVFEAVIPAPLS